MGVLRTCVTTHSRRNQSSCTLSRAAIEICEMAEVSDTDAAGNSVTMATPCGRSFCPP
jgi:hypothetical protein